MVPALFTVYCIHPPAMHRFVGYLEETACKTYVNVIHHVETPGTKLHTAWANLDAPVLGKGYYKVRPCPRLLLPYTHGDADVFCRRLLLPTLLRIFLSSCVLFSCRTTRSGWTRSSA